MRVGIPRLELWGGCPLELQRVGDLFQAATSHECTNYTLVPGSTLSVVMPTNVMDGLAVSSHSQGNPETVAYDAVTIGSPATPPTPPPPASLSLSGWSCSDIGNAAIAGR